MPILDIQAEGSIAAITFQYNGDHVVGGTGLGTVRKWGTSDGKEVGRMIRAGECEVGAVAASRDGQWIVGGTTTGSAIVWDGKTHEKVAEIKIPHEGWVLSVDISPDCKTFATGSYDETATLWKLTTAENVWGPARHPSHVGGIRFSPSGDRLATITWDDLAIRIFDSRTGDLIFRIPNAVCTVYENTFAWTDNGQRMYSAYETSIKQYDITATPNSLRAISTWKVEPHFHVQHISVSNSGQFVACSIERPGGDRAINFWDTLTHTKICGHIRLEGRLRSVAISRDDTRIAFGRYDDKIALYNLRDLLPHSYFVIRNTPALVSPLRSHSTNIPLINVNDKAFEPWIRGKLGNAEAVLSDEISSSNRDHHAFANRALIRARAKQFEEAIDDAEKSIHIQESPISLIAKSIALVGDGKVHDGNRACDLAIARAGSRDGGFLRVIKSIILCMADDRENSISHVEDMVVEMDDRSLDHFVRAQMHSMFGERQLSRGEYDRAVESFRLAQPSIPLPESPYLTAISLIFCWHFEDLSLNAKRGLCEALYGADRPKEAVDMLFEIMDSFNEEVRPSPLTLDWRRDFTKRCVPILERTGDSALASNDYETASIHYTLVITLSEVHSKERLEKWINAKLRSNNSWKEVLRASVEFNLSRITMYKAACEVLLESGRLAEAIECLDALKNGTEWATIPPEEVQSAATWISDSESRYPQQLHERGDFAMKARRYDEAISHYSAALSLNPPTPHDLLVKRSRAYAANHMWENALNDANRAIQLDPSSFSGYERRHAALHGAGRHNDAIDAYETMLLTILQSSDPEIRNQSSRYITPRKTEKTIRAAVRRAIEGSPRELINTQSGRLLNKSAQALSFESQPIFAELISSTTTEIDRARIEREVAQYYQYATFSHKWEDYEPLFDKVVNVVVYNLDDLPTHRKLQTFCRVVREAGLNWAWSDTCCINKGDHFVLQEALASMFRWYHGSALTVVFLLDVERLSKWEDLTKSIWNTRAWTLQEYLASKVVRFYTQDWTPFMNLDIPNHKESPEIIAEMEKATGVSAHALMALRPGLGDIRKKLRLASTRDTTRVEDAAYSLLGIFGISLPVTYGEGDQALGRLLAQLLTSSGNTSILAWTGRSGSFNSCLPTSITVFKELPTTHVPTVPLALTGTTTAVNAVGSVLHDTSSIDMPLAVRLHDRLSKLPILSFAGQRMRLPCLAFKLGRVSGPRRGLEGPFRARATALGIVELNTTEDLFLLDSLYLVHPWIDCLLDLRPIETVSQTQPEDTDSGVSESASPVESRVSSFDEDNESLRPPSPVSPARQEARVLAFISRLRQPIGALLLTRTRRHAEEYRRVASESLITVQVNELTPEMMEALIQSVRVLDVL